MGQMGQLHSLGRAQGDVFWACFMSFSPFNVKAFNYVLIVSYDLSLILIVVMLKALIISVALIITSIIFI